MVALTFEEVSTVNRARSEKWHAGYTIPWSGSDWANAMGGECGEAQNVVKKLRRAECGMAGKQDAPSEELITALGKELADTFFYLDLVANHYGIDLPAAIIQKFNEVSEREGFDERLYM